MELMDPPSQQGLPQLQKKALEHLTPGLSSPMPRSSTRHFHSYDPTQCLMGTEYNSPPERRKNQRGPGTKVPMATASVKLRKKAALRSNGHLMNPASVCSQERRENTKTKINNYIAVLERRERAHSWQEKLIMKDDFTTKNHQACGKLGPLWTRSRGHNFRKKWTAKWKGVFIT